jgi:hypothetical protein
MKIFKLLTIISTLLFASCSFQSLDSHECTIDLMNRYIAAESINESDSNFNSVVALKKLFSDKITIDSAEFILANISVKNQLTVEKLLANAFKGKAAGASSLYEEIKSQIPLSIKKLIEAQERTQKSVIPEILRAVLNSEGIPYAQKICKSDGFFIKILHYFKMY